MQGILPTNVGRPYDRFRPLAALIQVTRLRSGN